MVSGKEKRGELTLKRQKRARRVTYGVCARLLPDRIVSIGLRTKKNAWFTDFVFKGALRQTQALLAVKSKRLAVVWSYLSERKGVFFWI